jgi:hypothetical protein
MITGALFLFVGALLHFAPWSLNWFGRLPGDIRIETQQGKVFMPITSMLIVSVVVTVLVNLFRRW